MKWLLIKLIQLYRSSWPLREPFVRMFVSADTSLECRFTPTCSEYTVQALEKHGVIKGLTLGIKRVLRCRPGNPGGVEPVP